MEHRETDDTIRIDQLSSRYRVPQQEIARWIEQGYATSDVDWAYRFSETSPQADIAEMLGMRRQGMTWDDVRRSLEQSSRGERNPAEQEEGRKLVPGGERRTSRYFYLNDARLLEDNSGPERETGYEGTPSRESHHDKPDSWTDQQSVRKDKNEES